MNTANLLSIGRILMIPLFVVAFVMPWQEAHFVAAILFAFAAFTDWLDGFVARSLSQTTPFGAFIDPIADKLMVVIALILIVSRYPSLWLAVPAAIIVARELTISGLREWMSARGQQDTVSVSFLGKVKTAIQMFALTALILYQAEPVWWIEATGLLFLYVATFLTVWSMWQYLRSAWPDLTL